MIGSAVSKTVQTDWVPFYQPKTLQQQKMAITACLERMDLPGRKHNWETGECSLLSSKPRSFHWDYKKYIFFFKHYQRGEKKHIG